MKPITNTDYDKLELAIDRYVDGLDIDDLIQIVTDDLWTYYRKSASSDEVKEFIDNMQVTDEDVEPMNKEQDCTCGLDENGQWSDEVFDRFGCDCDEEQERE